MIAALIIFAAGFYFGGIVMSLLVISKRSDKCAPGPHT